MKPNQSNYLVPVIAVLAFSISGGFADSVAGPVGSAFAYQGRLNDGGQPANGTYDVMFALYAAPSPSGGAQVGTAITNLNLVVSNGLFNVTIDFGADAFNGDARWLQIGVRTNGSSSDFQYLTPLQALQPQPYALYTLKAGTATVASNLVDGTYWGALNLSNPSNTVAGTFTGHVTGDVVGNVTGDLSGNAATATVATDFSGPLAGDVTGTQNATVVSSVGGLSAAQVASGASAANGATAVNTPDAIVKRDSLGNFAAGSITAAGVSGDGSGLTGLDASQLASGTLADSHLSTNVALLNAPQTFSGSNLFSGVVQLTNTSNAFFGTFTGDGGGMSNLSVSAANVLGPLPSAQLSGTLPSGLLAGSYSNPLAFNNPANTFAGTFTGNGSSLIGMNPASLSPGTAAIDISGNAATATTAANASAAVTANNFSGVLAGDVTGLQSATIVQKISGVQVSPTSPSASQFLRYDGSQWVPGGVALETDVTGTLADSQLSANVGLLSANQVFSGSNRFSGIVEMTNTANTFAGGFIGNGAGLTALNPASLSAGTAAINISGNAVTATTANTAASAATAAIAGSAANFTGSLAGDVTGNQGTTVVGQIRGTPVSGAAPAANQHLRYDGSQWAPGNVALATDTTGILADSHLSTNVGLLNANQIFSGSNWFSGVVQLTNTANAFSGTLSGNGAGLTNLTVNAANVVGTLPATQLIGPLPANLLVGTYPNALTLNNPANSFIGNGAGLTGVNANTLAGLGAASFWQLGGNAGTTVGVNFVGTTDNQPLEFKVNGVRALRLEPNGSGAPNVVGGASVNLVNPGTVGAIIGGGGAMIYNGLSYTNEVASDFGTIGGGLGNTISTNSPGSTIGGGEQNLINSPHDYQSGVPYATIGGGYVNVVASTNSTIAGGCSNFVDSQYAFVGGGMQNSISRYGNGGSLFYELPTPASGSTIAGGIQNNIEDGPDGPVHPPVEWMGDAPGLNTVGGGSGNLIAAGEGGGAYGNTVAGGVNNGMFGWHFFETIGGGSQNFIGDADYSIVFGCTIAGGYSNVIVGSFFDTCTIGGGWGNIVGNFNGFHSGCTIGGGIDNFVYGEGGTVAGGSGNSISCADPYYPVAPCTIAGGEANDIYDSDYATVSGGLSNSVSGDFGTIAGGQNNFATTNAYAAGYRAKAVHSGAFVWAGGNTNDFFSSSENTFNIYATRGVLVNYGGQDSDGNGLQWLVLGSQTPGKVINVYNGAYLSTGGSWVNVCDRNAKKEFEPVNSREVLERVSKLPLATWSYRSETEPARHLGPVAQDFHAAFGLGVDDKHIAALDSSGVALAAIQGLNHKVEEQMKAKDAEIEELKQAVSELRKLVSTLAQKSNGGGE